MYNKIAVIGLGTLGGFIAKSISEIESIREIVLLDYDKVESKNLRNSIYNNEHIDRFKVNCLKNIIRKDNKNIKVSGMISKYIEDETKIPECDLVIDCRDYIYDRGNSIDVRMYISSRYLVIDCRKNMTYQKHHQGQYISNISRMDLKNASFNAALFIHRGLINDLIRRQAVYEFELDYNDMSVSKCISKIEEKPDVIYDVEPNSNKLLNLEQHVYPIIDMSKKSDIEIYVGDKNNPIGISHIPKMTLQNYNDVVRVLSSMLCDRFNYNYYLVTPKVEGNKFTIQLLPETGAA